MKDMSYFPNELLNMYMEDSIIYVKEDTLRVFSNGLTITYDHKSTFKVNVYPQNNSLCSSIEVTTQPNLVLKNKNHTIHYRGNITHVIKLSVVNMLLTHVHSILMC